METFFQEPKLFDTYLAFDPSLWWNHQALVNDAGSRLHAWSPRGQKSLYLASSEEPGIIVPTQRLADVLGHDAPISVQWHYEPMPGETHATIYHPAALRAFLALFKPATSR